MDKLWKMRDVADIPLDLRPSVDEHLKRVRHLVPPWVTSVRVYFQPAPHEKFKRAEAVMSIDSEYRTGLLSIYPMFLDSSEEYRHACMVHEICHFPVHPLYSLANNLVKNLVSDEGMRKVLFEQIRVACEGAVEDMSQMILRGEK